MIIRIFLQDEVPAIGSGWRNIEVVRLGYKWVLIKHQGKGKRIKRKVWDKITTPPEPKGKRA